MRRLVYVVLLAAPAACTMATDDRPHTVQYVTEAVLQPSCGEAQCHSTFSKNATDIFDTVVGVRSSIVRNSLVTLASDIGDNREDPNASRLIISVTNPDGLTPAVGRMPWDAPLPNADVELMREWIRDGARGAQCDPDVPMGLACDHTTLRECGPDWNFSTPFEDCAARGSNWICRSPDRTTAAACACIGVGCP